ncbi:CBS domain-containing protein [Terrilactibacillus sp. S3-3]|nr:CBS domain-containing protein [Terrilactibacillus sp. S3-3]
MFVADIMTEDFVCCTENQTLHDVLPMFTQVHSNMLPVVNRSDRLIGIITKNKIFKVLANQPSFETTVDHCYNPYPIYLRPSDTLEYTRQLFVKHKIGHAPVVDENMTPVGVISTQQVLSSYNILLSQTESQLALLFNNLNFGLLSINTNLEIKASNSLATDNWALKTINSMPLKIRRHCERLKN